MSTAFHSLPAAPNEARSPAPLLIFGDHASRVIPARYSNLGLSGDDLTRHIAWDIGTETVIRALCERFGAAGHICGFSRLLIDANRDPHAAGLIPQSSDGTQISGNQNLAAMERALRVAEFYAPYHGALAAAVEALRAGHDNPLLVSVHSFTPKPRIGPDSAAGRAVDIGLLVKDDTRTAQRFMAGAAAQFPRFDCRINEPYSAYDLNYTIDVHAKGLRHLAIEIRQDHIETDAKAQALSVPLGNILNNILEGLI